jgi:quinol-cytochrome oxidoreductase complex cytochrome b subunit
MWRVILFDEESEEDDWYKIIYMCIYYVWYITFFYSTITNITFSLFKPDK